MAVIVGVIVWFPCVLLLGGVSGLGRGAHGWELLAALLPIGAIAVPALVRASNYADKTLFLWLLALSPLLGVAGAISALAFEDFLYGNVYNPAGQRDGALLSLALWSAIALLLELIRCQFRD